MKVKNKRITFMAKDNTSSSSSSSSSNIEDQATQIVHMVKKWWRKVQKYPNKQVPMCYKCNNKDMNELNA